MCFSGVCAQYLTSSAAAIAVADEERGGEREKEGESEGERGGTARERRIGSLPLEEIIVKGAS